MNDSVVAIVSAFFIIGITVGIIAVIALSVLRADRVGDPGHPDDLVEYGPRRRGDQPGDPGRDNAGRDGHPRWPGDYGNDFSGK